MKYKLFVVSLLLLSCNSSKPNINLIDISLDTWILENQEIKSLLSDFIHALEEYPSDEKSFIAMQYGVINDSTYSLTLSDVDICACIYPAPLTIFQFENRIICLKTNQLTIFRINDDFLDEFMEKNYPVQYAYYLKFGNYPPPITGGWLEWELIFQDDHFICKKVLHSPDTAPNF